MEKLKFLSQQKSIFSVLYYYNYNIFIIINLTIFVGYLAVFGPKNQKWKQ